MRFPRLYEERCLVNNDGYPVEVLEYLRSGVKHAVSVRASCPYTIIVEFEDGQIREEDLSEDLEGELSCLRDWNVFKTVYLDDANCIAWDTESGHIDISRDTVYIYGKRV